MITLTAERLIKAPIDAVFDRLTDHARYHEFPPITHSELLKPGETEANGLGALRLIVARPFRLEERITLFDRPQEFHYHIEKTTPVTIQHDYGWLKFSEVKGGCRVLWKSRFEISVPVIGRLIERLMASRFQAGFFSVLKAVAVELEPQSADRLAGG